MRIHSLADLEDILNRATGLVADTLLAPPLPEKIAAGERNSTLTSFAGTMFRRHASREAVLAALQAENSTRCDPPLPADEIEQIVTSVARYAPPEPIERYPWRPFPIHILPQAVRVYAVQAAAAIGCDVSMVAVPLIAALAGAIGNSAEIEIKRGSWFEPAIAWVVVIASSGTKKSPAIKAATAGVRAEQKRLNETHNNDKKKYDLESASYNAMEKDKRPLEKPQAPRLRHAYTTNATIEALAERLQYSSGMLLVSDELSGFLSSFGEYKNARNSDVQGYLSMFSGVQLKIDRKTSEQPTIQIERPNVSIAGGIQPGIAKRIFKPEYFDNGLIARFLVVAPPEMFSGYTDAEIDPAVRRGFDALFEELYARASGNTQTMRLTPDALALWKSFQDAHALETKAMFHERLREAWSKLEGYCARFALILQAVENATAHSFESEITANVMQRAIELCRWFAYETRRAYSILSGDQHAVEQDSLIGWIYGQGGRVTARQLQRHSRQYQNSEQAKAALHTLVDAGSGHWEYPGPANKGGAPSEIFVLGTTNNNGPAAANPPQPGAVPATLPGTNSIFAVDNTATKGVSGGFVSVNAVGSPPKLRLPPPRRVSKPGNVTKSNGDENHD